MKIKLVILMAACAVMLIVSSPSIAQKCTEVGSIKRVTKASSAKFETVTFEVLSKSPDFQVSNAKPPFSEYGSERTLRIRGKYFKSIVFRGVFWTCKIAEDLKAGTSNIKAVKSIEQFEGQVEYVIGYNKKGSYVGQSSIPTKRGRNVILKFKK